MTFLSFLPSLFFSRERQRQGESVIARAEVEPEREGTMKRARTTSLDGEKGKKGNTQNRDEEPEHSIPTIPNLTVHPFAAVDSPSKAYSSRHSQAVHVPCSTLRAAKRVKEKETESPVGDKVAKPVDGTFPGANDLSNSQQADSTHRTCHSAASSSANLNNVIDNIVKFVLPQAQNSAPTAGRSRYHLRHAKPVTPIRASLRVAARVKKNKTFIDPAAESEDGSTPMNENVPIAQDSPRSHKLEESNPCPPLEHLNFTTDSFVPTVSTLAVCIVNNCDKKTLRDAEMEPTYNETRLEKSGDTRNESNGLLARSLSFNLTEMVDLIDDGSSSQSEVDFHGRPLVTVEGYKVKEEVAPTLRRILSKHGDIAASSSFQHLKLRSSLLEYLCEIIHDLQALEFTKVTIGKLKSMLALVHDLKDHLEVSWLRKRLEDIIEARVISQEYSSTKEARKKTKQDIEETEKENVALKEKLRVNHEKLAALKAKTTTTTNTTSSEIKAKMKCFYKRSLVEDLF